MSLRAQLNDSMKEAMKAKDTKRLATVRLMLAALKDRDIAARSETSRDLLGDDEILSLLAKMIKQREESALAFDTGNRPELAAGEREEIAIIRSFMPAWRAIRMAAPGPFSRESRPRNARYDPCS